MHVHHKEQTNVIYENGNWWFWKSYEMHEYMLCLML